MRYTSICTIIYDVYLFAADPGSAEPEPEPTPPEPAVEPTKAESVVEPTQAESTLAEPTVAGEPVDEPKQKATQAEVETEAKATEASPTVAEPGKKEEAKPVVGKPSNTTSGKTQTGKIFCHLCIEMIIDRKYHVFNSMNKTKINIFK